MNPKWSWTEQKRQAAQLLASGHINHTQIAGKLGIARETLRRWNENEEFKTQIEHHRNQNQQQLKQELQQHDKTRADCQALLDKVTIVVEEITRRTIPLSCNRWLYRMYRLTDLKFRYIPLHFATK